MTLIKWNDPSRGLESSPINLPVWENLFSNLFGKGLLNDETANYVPAVNITEKEKSYQIEVSAPGFKKEDFNVRVEEGLLTISAAHKEEKNESERNVVRKEFNYGSFSRSFNVADLIDEEKIDARYENGVLKLELPKNQKAQAKNVKQIKIS